MPLMQAKSHFDTRLMVLHYNSVFQPSSSHGTFETLIKHFAEHETLSIVLFLTFSGYLLKKLTEPLASAEPGLKNTAL